MRLVERLRAEGCPHKSPDNGCFVCEGCAADLTAAADEIERLTAELTSLRGSRQFDQEHVDHRGRQR